MATPSTPTTAESTFYVPPGSTDPGWKYAYLIERTDSNTVGCRLCGKVIKGGINRMKQHLAHIKGNTRACPKADGDVQKEIRDYVEDIMKKKNEKVVSMRELREQVTIKTSDGSSNHPSEGGASTKRPHVSEDDVPLGTIMRQTVIKDALAKEERARVNKFVAKFFYDADIPFNVVTKNSFIRMCEAIGQYGSGYKPPSYYEITETLLKEEVDETKEYLKSHNESWKNNGCSIMTDAWTDMRGRSIMNLCVNCDLGTTFLKSVDASADSHTAEYISSLVEDCIKDIGEDNVVQVVTDNASANMAAGRLLKTKYPRIFWSSCAAHCIDLVLEEIGKESRIKNCITKARTLTLFIYSHAKTLSLMRQFTQKGEIVRPGQTRFATTFLTLQSVMDKKEKLRLMFSSDEWRECKWSKTRKGEVAASIVLSSSFWSQVSLTLKIFCPLVYLLRVVDGERKPSMGFVYGGLEDAKNEIKAIFKNVEHSYKPFIDAITLKTKGRLDSPLHLAAFYLNPYYFYRDSDAISKDSFVVDGLMECVEVFYPELEIQDAITKKEIHIYRRGEGAFGKPMAVRQRSTNDDDFNPAHWWMLYGSQTPYLKEMALRILKLTSSSSACERNWSSFAAVLKCQKPRRITLYWLQYTCGAVGLSICTGWLLRHSSFFGSPDIDNWITEAKESAAGFWDSHVEQPLLSIRDELFETFRGRHKGVIEAEEVQLTADSLHRMLLAFSEQTKGQKFPENASDQEMLEIVMSRYEKELMHPIQNLFSGEIARAMLIQIQKLKLDLETAMLELDQILKANEINFAILAALPAFFLSVILLMLVRAWVLQDKGAEGRGRMARLQRRLLVAEVEKKIMQFQTYLDEGFEEDAQCMFGQVLYSLDRLYKAVEKHASDAGEWQSLRQDILDVGNPRMKTEHKLVLTSRMGRVYESMLKH